MTDEMNICLCGESIPADQDYCGDCVAAPRWDKVCAGEYESGGWRILKWRNGPPAYWRVINPDGKTVGSTFIYSLRDATVVAEQEMKGTR